MQNNIITKISPTVRIIVLFLLMLIMLLAKSLFLILFMTTLTLILMIFTEKKVKLYVNTSKKIVTFLLFFLIIYIIIFENTNIFSILLFVYKFIIIIVLVEIFYFNIDFKQLHQAIYGLSSPLKRFKINTEQMSLDFVLSLYLIKFFINKKEEIKNLQIRQGKKMINIKNFIVPSFIGATNELALLQENLKIKFYKLTYNKSNAFSKFVLIIFLLLFVFSVFKEVIL